ncbi:hypothetical protein BCR44DRAFT_268066 [Catenaria anguillulae PL171]|uniref:Uncharacterized protein n=1 Tax=Catenaria anguillulae PL171 TaxID=765915 RepID=A0A1Y2HI38_9FUNG|nr:hypothetical protein BCR44DRAFT_268066 [Catenaria anguillulae PL171]
MRSRKMTWPPIWSRSWTGCPARFASRSCLRTGLLCGKTTAGVWRRHCSSACRIGGHWQFGCAVELSTGCYLQGRLGFLLFFLLSNVFHMLLVEAESIETGSS